MKTKSIYIHVPFCKNICSYCDFAKLYYNKKWASIYLDALNFEIKEKYKEEPIRTLYIGGGTPNALDLEELEKLFIILSIFKNVTEYTIECNIELLTLDQIKLFVKYGINRVSLGIQTSHQKYLKFLNRNHSKVEVENKIQMLKDNGISNINVDFIYALPGQTIKELKEDIEFFKSLSIPHISTYSLIIEPNTVLYNQNVNYVDEDIDASMYNLIIEELKEFNHYETSNFALPNYESKHNLTYWNNEEYYGFGLGASGYIDNIRYTNTRSLNDYINHKYILEKEELTKNDIIENEFMLGFRKIEGIDLTNFKSKFNLNADEMPIVKKLIQENKLTISNNKLRLTNEYIYLANEILVEFIGEDFE